MGISEMSKKEFIQAILHSLVTPNITSETHSSDDDLKYESFINSVKLGQSCNTQLPLDYAIKSDMFDLIKSNKVYIANSVKFKTTFTTERPSEFTQSNYNATYNGHEFEYSFLDNHPGIININRLKDIPSDYEGLMAVPPTVLEYKNIIRFNVHRVLYTPKHNGKLIYARVVVSNKTVNHV